MAVLATRSTLKHTRLGGHLQWEWEIRIHQRTAAIDGNRLAGHKAGLFATEQGTHIGNVRGRPALYICVFVLRLRPVRLALYLGVNASAGCLHRFHVQPPPDNPVIPHPENRHAPHGKGPTVGMGSRPMPL